MQKYKAKSPGQTTSFSLQNELDYGLGMHALVIELYKGGKLLWFGHGCAGHRTHSKTNVILAWMLWSLNSLKDEHCYGLGMGALATIRIWYTNYLVDDMDDRVSSSWEVKKAQKPARTILIQTLNCEAFPQS